MLQEERGVMDTLMICVKSVLEAWIPVEAVPYVGWSATLFSVAGSVLNAMKKTVGFYSWIVANILWLVIAILKAMPYQVALFMFYSCVCMYGIYNWNRKTGDSAHKPRRAHGKIEGQ